MVKNGYDKAFAAANVSVTSGLAIVIPPSIAFIVYGGIADASVPALFAAGILPGLLVAGFLMLTVYLISKKRGYRGLPRQESTWLVFNVNFQRFPTLDAKKLVNAPKMSAHHRGICHF